jgi:hypothetical protein
MMQQKGGPGTGDGAATADRERGTGDGGRRQPEGLTFLRSMFRLPVPRSPFPVPRFLSPVPRPPSPDYGITAIFLSVLPLDLTYRSSHAVNRAH